MNLLRPSYTPYALLKHQKYLLSTLWPSQLHQNRCCCTLKQEQVAGSESARNAKQLHRFYVPQLPTVVGAAVELDADEARHAVRVLRLKEGDAVELCDGKGGLVVCEIMHTDKQSATVMATAAPQAVLETGPQWVLAAACLTLKGGRTDWLIEKATELGAHSVLPLITERSQTGTTRSKFKSMSAKARNSSSSSLDDFQPSRLERLAVASSKQSLRAHTLKLQPAVALQDLLPSLQQSPVSLVATAGAPPVLQVLQQVLQHHQPGDQQAGTRQGHMLQESDRQQQQQQQQNHPESCGLPFWHGKQCYLMVGPEGDFTTSEVQMMVAAGVQPVGLGDLRLRTETAGLALLTAAMLFESSARR